MNSIQQQILSKQIFNFISNFFVLLILLLFPTFDCGGSESFPVSISNLNATHRSGQTFLSWEVEDKRVESYYKIKPTDEDGLTQPQFLKLTQDLQKQKDKGGSLKFKIYRHAEQINSKNIEFAQKVGEVEPLSSYYPYIVGEGWYHNIHSKLIIPRIRLHGGKRLSHNSEFFVYHCKNDETAFYAVIPELNHNPIHRLNMENTLAKSVSEQVGTPEPIFQWARISNKDHPFCWNNNPGKIYYYLRWVTRPYSNKPRRFLWSVAVPDAYKNDIPAALQVGLHGWGGNADCSTYWYSISPLCIRIATVNCPVQDWWYGYRENYGIKKYYALNEKIYNFTEKRLLSFIEWTQENWNIDHNKVFIEGLSMGGSGAISLGMKNGDIFSYVNSWVGISTWRESLYFRKGEKQKWGKINELYNYNGVKFDDWMDLSWWLTHYPKKETPFLSFSNGKNDGAIGWEQAVKTVKALKQTKRAFIFVWGMSGHGQRAKFILTSEKIGKNKSIPAFNNCSLDNDFGNAIRLETPQLFKNRQGKLLKDFYSGESEGQINTYLDWEVLEDQQELYKIRLTIDKNAPEKNCSVDMTPRNVQNFKTKPGQQFKWENRGANGMLIQEGTVHADENGLLTIVKILLSKKASVISIH